MILETIIQEELDGTAVVLSFLNEIEGRESNMPNYSPIVMHCDAFKELTLL